MTTPLTIQQVATLTGLTVHTLRYYERIGLIDPIHRGNNKHRLYRHEDMQWIEFLLKLRSTGLPIRQMQRYAELRRHGNHQESVSERKAILEQHTLSLEATLAELQGNLVVMRKKIAFYADMESNMKASAVTSSSVHSLDKEQVNELTHEHAHPLTSIGR